MQTKYIIPIVVVIVVVLAFGVGRWSNSSTGSLPEIPIAFVQMTQDVAVTIDVELDPSSRKPVYKDTPLHELKGKATYRFTNISDAPVALTFPPTKTRAISKHSVSHELSKCPDFLQKPQTIEIAPRQSTEFTGDWSNVVSGDPDQMLAPGAGRECFTFRPPENADPSVNHFSGTVIAFQSFVGSDNSEDAITTNAHLQLIMPAATHSH